MRVRALLAAGLVALLPGGAAQAQGGLSMGQVQSPVLTIDVDRLLAETLYGKRLAADLLARGEALRVENDRIAADLTAEERSLTEQRPSMPVEEFRAAADAFDAKVQRIRTEQDSKQQALESGVADDRAAFLAAATPVLAQLMANSGAAVLLEQRDVFLAVGAVDVTDEAIAAVDRQLGDGPDRSDGASDADNPGSDGGGEPGASADDRSPFATQAREADQSTNAEIDRR